MYGKGFVSILEMIIVMIALFITFSIFFPGFQYRSRWSDTLLLLKSRDLILTADRIGQLYDYSFSPTNLQTFLDTLIPTNETGIISWSEMEGTIKSSVWIACNCTNDQINDLTSWFRGLKINRREIGVLPCYTNLEAINPCLSSSDVLLIFGYKDLSDPVYLNTLKEYLKIGSGIVEITDLNSTMVLGDDVQEKIFGLGADSSDEAQTQEGMSEYDVFRDEVESPIKRPINTTVFSYHPWKYFYHIPIPLFASSIAGTIPTDDPPLPSPSCTQLSTGSLGIQVKITNVGGEPVGSPNFYKFWICDSDKVYFDTDLTEQADVILTTGDNFGIVDYYNSSLFWNFTLSYIDRQEKIGVSFKPDYRFSDFITYWEEGECECPPEKPGKCPKGEAAGLCKGKKEWAGENANLLAPGDGDRSRILIQASNITKAYTPIPGVILNSTEITRTAWIANFTADGVGDDERLLIISLLLWASNKRAVSVLSPGVKLGFKTSYVNSVNDDMFEVYKFNLGLGYPF